MVAAVSTTPNLEVTSRGANFHNPRWPLLLPSEAEKNVPPRRQKATEMTPRYLSSSLTSSSSNSTSTTSSKTSSSYSSSPRLSSPRPSQSHMATRTATPSSTPLTIKRSQSVERRRPAAGTPTEISNAARLLMTSARSLSVSFQGQSLCLPNRKATLAPTPAVARNSTSARKSTPERRKPAEPVKDQNENLKATDQQRWPARSKPMTSSMLTRSMDYGNDKSKLRGSALQKSMIVENNKKSKNEAKWKRDSKIAGPKNKVELADAANSPSVPAKTADEDSDSLSSGGSLFQVRGGPREIVVPARFWQDSNSKSAPKMMAQGKLIGAKKFLNGSSESVPRGISSSRGVLSPLREGVRPGSPSKFLSSSLNYPASRGMPSPTRTRNCVTTMSSNNVSNTPSILSYTADLRRGKMGEIWVLHAHELRLLYNRHLQWRFVKARAEAALLLQTEAAERSLYNAWVTTSKLRHSVKSKRTQLQTLRQNLKLHTILKGQVSYLESMELIDKDHCNSLSGAREALEASVVHLPLVGGATADLQQVNKAICYAADVMQAMASSICSQLTKAEQANSLISELANITAKEHALLAKCKDLLSSLTALQVNDCFLRTHILLVKHDP